MCVSVTLLGERPYRCSVCGSCFSTKGNLKVHTVGHGSGSVVELARPAAVAARRSNCSSDTAAPTPASDSQLSPTPPPRCSDRPGDDRCRSRVSPQSTTSTPAAAPSSVRRHCPNTAEQTSPTVAPTSTNAYRSENGNGVDSVPPPPPGSGPDLLCPNETARGCPVSAVCITDGLTALPWPPPPILTPVVPHSLSPYRAPTWLPTAGIRFPPTSNFRSPCCLPTATTTSVGTPDGGGGGGGEASFQYTSQWRRSPTFRSAAGLMDPLEQFMEVDICLSLCSARLPVCLMNVADNCFVKYSPLRTIFDHRRLRITVTCVNARPYLNCF